MQGTNSPQSVDKFEFGGLAPDMGTAISPRGDMPKYRVLICEGTPHVCHQYNLR